MLEQIVNQFDDSLKKIYNIEIGKEVIKTGLSYLSSGISNVLSSYVDSGVDYITDVITDEIGDMLGEVKIFYSLGCCHYKRKYITREC